MTNLVPAWLDHLTTDRAMADNTVATYARTLRTLPTAATATREDVEAWWHSRAHLSPAPRVSALAAGRAFCGWARECRHASTSSRVAVAAVGRVRRVRA